MFFACALSFLMELGVLLKQLNESQNDIKSSYAIVLIPGSGGCDSRYFTYNAGRSSRRECDAGGALRRTLLIEPAIVTADDYVFAATLAPRNDKDEQLSLTAPVTDLTLEQTNNDDVFLRDQYGSLKDNIVERFDDNVVLYNSNDRSTREEILEDNVVPTHEKSNDDRTNEIHEENDPPPVLPTTIEPKSIMEEIDLNPSPSPPPFTSELYDLPLPTMFRSNVINEPPQQRLTDFLENSRNVVSDLFRGFLNNDDYDINGTRLTKK